VWCGWRCSMCGRVGEAGVKALRQLRLAQSAASAWATSNLRFASPPIASGTAPSIYSALNCCFPAA
jgi:hypothetical protein